MPARPARLSVLELKEDFNVASSDLRADRAVPAFNERERLLFLERATLRRGGSRQSLASVEASSLLVCSAVMLLVFTERGAAIMVVLSAQSVSKV